MDFGSHIINSSDIGRQTPRFLDKEMLLAIVFVWLCSVFSALIAFGTFRLDAPRSALEYAQRCSLGFSIAAPVILISCRLVSAQLWSRAACIIVTLLTALMFVGISVNMAGWLRVEGSSWEHPGFAPWSDSSIIYLIAQELYEGKPSADFVPTGYPRIIIAFFNLFGQGVLAPLLLNALCMSLSACLAGKVCAALCPAEDMRRRVWFGILLFAIIPSVAYYGTLLLKEALITLGVSLFALILADLYRGRLRLGSLTGAAIGALLLMLTRHHVALMLIVCALICYARAAYKKAGTQAGRFNTLSVILLLCFVSIQGGRCFRGNRDFVLLDTSNAEGNSQTMATYDTAEHYSSLFGNYYAKKPLERTVYLPLTVSAQYFPPFPWNYTRDKALGAFVPVAHLSLLWYIVGGLVFGYFAMCIYRKKASGGLQAWALMWALCYIGTAYMSAGTVPRYYLPFMALCIPMALQTVLSVKRGAVSLRVANIYAGIYVLLLTIGLVLAYNFLKR
ncbi:MAG: hypothetical protein NC402_07935 [Prevotella sp.]|nr:hypothetical protein [Prevotella sp.]MCM1075672.1 hypothetical protein [Ruminococcus sp.]